jgi:hypothetical protein
MNKNEMITKMVKKVLSEGNNGKRVSNTIKLNLSEFTGLFNKVVRNINEQNKTEDIESIPLPVVTSNGKGKTKDDAIKDSVRNGLRQLYPQILKLPENRVTRINKVLSSNITQVKNGMFICTARYQFQSDLPNIEPPMPQEPFGLTGSPQTDTSTSQVPLALN